MKKILLVLLVIGVGLGIIKQMKNQDLKSIVSKITHQLPAIPKVVHYRSPLQCQFQEVKITSVDQTPIEVSGSNYLKAYASKLLVLQNQEEIPVYLVTDLDGSWNQGQDFLLVTNCKSLEDEALKAATEALKEQPCTGMYLWDQKQYQVRRFCGHIVKEEPVILDFKK